MTVVLNDFSAIFSRWRIWWIMGFRDIQMRYRRSFLGPFWISLTMAAMVFGIGFLFSQIFDIEFKAFLAYIATSFLIWGILQSNLNESCNIMIDSEAHLRAMRLPASILAAQMVWRNTLIFLHNLIAIGAVLLYANVDMSASLILLLPALAILSLIGFFSAIVLGPYALRYRDLGQVVMNVMQIAFFITPIIWMPSQGRLSSVWLDYNPFFHLVEIARGPLLGYWPSATNWAVSIGILIIAAIMAYVATAVSREKVYLWL